MVFSDDFLHFLKIKKKLVELTNFNYLVALKLRFLYCIVNYKSAYTVKISFSQEIVYLSI